MKYMQLVDFFRCYCPAVIENIFGMWLKKKRIQQSELLFSMELLGCCAEIEIQSMPRKLCVCSKCTSIQEVLDMCDCKNISQIYFEINRSWFCILVRHPFYWEILELASQSKKCGEIYKVARFLLDTIIDNKIIRASCLDNTSYRLIHYLAEKGKIKTYNEFKENIVGEKAHTVWFKFDDKTRAAIRR